MGKINKNRYLQLISEAYCKSLKNNKNDAKCKGKCSCVESSDAADNIDEVLEMTVAEFLEGFTWEEREMIHEALETLPEGSSVKSEMLSPLEFIMIHNDPDPDEEEKYNNI